VYAVAATEVRIGQVWEQVSKHERGMQLEVVRSTGHRWVLRPIGGGPSKKRGLREGIWTLSTEQINSTCRLVRDAN
jgi:hypothetical protein